MGQALGDGALVPSILLGLYEAEMNKEVLVPLLSMYLAPTLTCEGGVFIPISLT